MNGFGLWDTVITKGRDILAAPIELRFLTAGGQEGKWESKSVRLVKNSPNLAIFEAEAISKAVQVKTTSTIEIDGCMKVQMELLPGKIGRASCRERV